MANETDYAMALQARVDRMLYWRPIIEKTLLRYKSLKTFNELVHFVVTGQWFFFDNGKAFVFIQPDLQTQGLDLYIYLAGGNLKSVLELNKVIEDFGRTVNAKRITALGRIGFAKFNPGDWKSTKQEYWIKEL
jgi:hypothetical protein